MRFFRIRGCNLTEDFQVLSNNGAFIQSRLAVYVSSTITLASVLKLRSSPMAYDFHPEDRSKASKKAAPVRRISKKASNVLLTTVAHEARRDCQSSGSEARRISW
jgi:hypothetical protein